MVDIKIQDREKSIAIKKRITDFYENKPIDRLPFMFDVARYKDWSLAGRNEIVKTAARAIKNHDFDLNEQLKNCRQKLESKFEDDTIFGLGCFTGVGTIASAFGCPTKFFKDKLPWTEHVIEDAGEIIHLKPNIGKAELFNLALEKAFYFREKTGVDLPIKLPDIQGPVDTAGIIMKDSSLFEAFYTHPKEIHLLMKMVTETLIKMVRIFKEKVTNLFCFSHGFWLPYGIHLSDDFLAVLSPRIYEEFVRPYNEIIAKEFAGLFLHSCGNYLHQVPNLLTTKELMGVHFHEFSIKKMVEKTQDKIVLAAGFVENPYLNFKELSLCTEEELIRHSWVDLGKLERLQTKKLIFLGSCFEEDRADEYYQKMLSSLRKMAGRVE